MATGIDVAGVDGAGEARRGTEARRPVRTARQTLQLGELDHVRAIRAHAVLAVLLGPVERAVGEPDQVVAVARVGRRGGNPDREGARADLLQLECRDSLDDRGRRGQRAALVVAGQQQCELVAAEAERLAGLPQAGREPREDAVAGRVAEAVVDPLEVVHVDEAEGQRQRLLLRVPQLALDPFVEMPAVAEARQRVGQRQAHRAQRADDRALVELDREQRTDKRDDRKGERSQSTTRIRAAEAISEKGTIVTRTFERASERSERRALTATTAVIRIRLTAYCAEAAAPTRAKTPEPSFNGAETAPAAVAASATTETL